MFVEITGLGVAELHEQSDELRRELNKLQAELRDHDARVGNVERMLIALASRRADRPKKGK